MKLPITGFEPHISGVGSDGSTNQLCHNHCCMLLGSFKGSSHLTHGAAVDCRFGKLKILLSVCKNATFCNIHIWKMQLVWIILFLVVHKTSLLYGEKCFCASSTVSLNAEDNRGYLVQGMTMILVVNNFPTFKNENFWLVRLRSVYTTVLLLWPATNTVRCN